MTIYNVQVDIFNFFITISKILKEKQYSYI